MRLGLGNMLVNGGGSLNPDGLSLDLQFATDKTLTARKGPTPTFTRASTATFVGSNGLIQSAAINDARFDHDPVTLACKGLLIEESRTNSLLHSANFKDTTSSNYWENLSATTVTVNQTTSPDGGVNADLLTTSAAAFDCLVRKGSSWVGSTQYSYSIFLKRGPSNYRYVGFYIGANASATQYPYFDFDNPTTVQVPTITSGTVNSTGVDAYPNGWYRIKITFTTAAVPPVGSFGGVYISSSTGVLLGTNPAGNDCYIWGIQSELGAFPTSYIPTTTASVVRSADLCSITGSDFALVYNQSEHTLFAEASAMSHANFGSYLSFDNGTATEQSALSGFPSPNNAVCYEVDGNVVQAQINNAITLNQNNKLAAGMKANSFQVALNNTLGTEDTSGTMATATTFKIGSSWNNTVINGTYKQVKVFKKRLPNAKLQTLTT